jgi:DNA-binding NtrC family response regulator
MGTGSLETERENLTVQSLPKNLSHGYEAENMKRVLVVDDDPEIRLLYEEELSEEGYDIISSNGERGLIEFIAAKSPDLIVLDVDLKSQSGPDLLQDIRNAFHWTPVIVITAYPPFKTDQKSVGADAYVTKSSDLTGVKQQIKKSLATPRPLNEKGIIPGKNAEAMVMKPAAQLHMPFRKRPE